MEYLGFSRHHGAVYEGTPDNGYRASPLPSLAPIRFFNGKELPDLAPWYDGLAPVIFREDDFDAVTKIRRGRVFKMGGPTQPHTWKVHDPLQQSLRTVMWAHGVAQEIDLATFQHDHLPDLTKLALHALPTVALGWEPHVTFWKLISIESNLVGTPVLTLWARHSLGDTPEILTDKVPAPALKLLLEAVESVEGSVNRLAAVDVIDRCRNALSIVFGWQVGDMSKDLGQSLKAYVAKQDPPNENICSSCGWIVARLHSRGKSSEQVGKGLRPPIQSDADLALSCLRTVLIEFGWAR